MYIFMHARGACGRRMQYEEIPARIAFRSGGGSLVGCGGLGLAERCGNVGTMGWSSK